MTHEATTTAAIHQAGLARGQALFPDGPAGFIGQKENFYHSAA